MWSMQYLRGAEGIHVPVRLPSSTLETEGCIICFNWRAFVWCGFRVAGTPGLVVAIMVWTYPIMVCFILTGVVRRQLARGGGGGSKCMDAGMAGIFLVCWWLSCSG